MPRADDERRRRLHVAANALRLVRENARLVRLGIEALLPRIRVHSQRLHVAEEDLLRVVGVVRFAVPLGLVAEELIVHLPELALVRGARGGVGRRHRVLVHREREVEEAIAREPRVHDAVAHVRLGDHGEVAARRTLEVGELHDLDGRVRIAHQVALGLRGRDGRRGDVRASRAAHARRAR